MTQVISDKHDIANAFNNYFYFRLASSITSNTNPMSYINIVEPTLYMANVTNNDVNKVNKRDGFIVALINLK